MGKRWEKGNYCDIIPDVLFGVDLSDCCYQHDMDYWTKPISRKMADIRLANCIQRKFNVAGKGALGYHVSNWIYVFLRAFGWIRWEGIIK